MAAVHARLLAATLGAELTLVSCVFDPLTQFELERAQPSAAAVRTKIVEDERATLERLAQSLRDWGVRVDTRVVWTGHPQRVGAGGFASPRRSSRRRRT
jgi:hypothetical protein